MNIHLIFAATPTGVIGNKGALPWKQSADMQHFKTLTTGHHVLMGRNTYQSLPSRLSGRVELVLSRAAIQDCATFSSVTEAVAHAKQSGETDLFVIGGAEVLKICVRVAHYVHRTVVGADLEGDSVFDFDERGWLCSTRSRVYPADDKNQYPYFFETWCLGAL